MALTISSDLAASFCCSSRSRAVSTFGFSAAASLNPGVDVPDSPRSSLRMSTLDVRLCPLFWPPSVWSVAAEDIDRLLS